MEMWTIIGTGIAILSVIIGTGIGVASFVYTVTGNFKNDINLRLDKIDQRFDKMENKFNNDLVEIKRSLNRLEGALLYREILKLDREEEILGANQDNYAR